jgi:ribosomal protein S18 acetylase RimI-like enzyme
VPGLRPATDDDREFLLAVYAGTRADELARAPWPDDAKREFVEMQFRAQDVHYRRSYPRADVSVILDGERAVGRLFVDRREREIGIVDIALLPEARGRGLGTALLRDLIAESEASGRPLEVHVEVENPARSLYDRLGFRVVEDVGVYLKMRREAGMSAH